MSEQSMTAWEFLIQQKGDHAWLPLESPSVEILEGCYHLIAQGLPAGTPVQVQIVHQYDHGEVWQEGFQQYLQKADIQGVVNLLPLTYVQAGLWQIQCTVITRDAISGMAQPIRHAIALQVSAKDCEMGSEWDFTEAFPAHEETPVFPTPALDRTSQPRSQPQSLPGQKKHPFSAPIPAAAMHEIARMVETLRQAQTQPTQPEVQSTASGRQRPAVVLPNIPKEVPAIPFKLSTGSTLPPLVYQPESASQPPEPQLPYLPSLATKPVVWADSTGIFLEPLRQVTSIAIPPNQSTAQEAFKSLAFQRRFWKTLNTLATVT